MGLLTFALNVTLDGCCDHREMVANDEMLRYWTRSRCTRCELPSLGGRQIHVTFAEWDASIANGGCSQKPEDCGWGRERRAADNASWDDVTKQLAVALP